MDSEIVTKARRFAKVCQSKEVDDAGKSYFAAHIVPLVEILKQVTKDADIISAAYLHDTIESYCGVTYDTLVQEFGPRIADLVNEVTKESNNCFPRLKTRDAIMIKFADRLSNISRMETWPKERREQYLNSSKFWK